MAYRAAKKAKGINGLLHASFQKNQSNLKLVLADPAIQDAVRQARKTLGLPPHGLADDSEVIGEWNRSMMERSMQILNSPELRRMAAQIRQNLKEKKVDPVMANKQLEMVYGNVPIHYLTSTVNFICRHHNLPANFADSIRTYIVCNVISAPVLSFSVVSTCTSTNDDTETSVVFYAQPTNADIAIMKSMFGELGGQYLPTIEPIKDIDKKLRAEELWNADRNRNALDNKYDLSAEDLAGELEHEFGSPTKPSLVYESTRELKERRKKHFRHLGNTS